MINKFLQAVKSLPEIPDVKAKWNCIVEKKYELQNEELFVGNVNNTIDYIEKQNAINKAAKDIEFLECNSAEISMEEKCKRIANIVDAFGTYLEKLHSLEETKSVNGSPFISELNITTFIGVLCKYGHTKEAINVLKNYEGNICLIVSDLISNTLLEIADFQLIALQEIEFAGEIYGLFTDVEYEYSGKNVTDRFYVKVLLFYLPYAFQDDKLPWDKIIVSIIGEDFISDYKNLVQSKKSAEDNIEEYLSLFNRIISKHDNWKTSLNIRLNYICLYHLLHDMLAIVLNQNNMEDEDFTDNQANEILYYFVRMFFQNSKNLINFVKESIESPEYNAKHMCSIVHNLFLARNEIQCIADLLKVDTNVENDIYYYSSFSTLRYMLPEKCASEELRQNLGSLKIMHIAYMNDPAEGVGLCTLFDLKCKLLNSDGYIKKLPYAFIKCFTRQKDYLPMWNLYGDKGKGCSLKLKWHSKIFNLYNVAYINRDSAILTEEHNPNIDVVSVNEKLANLKFLIENCKDKCSQKYLENLEDTIVDILKKIRFIFKDDSYSYEKEIRCVILPPDTISLDKFELLGNDSVPKLGITIKKLFEVEEIILGPKFENLIDCLPYLQQQLDKLAIELNYDTPKISLSRLEYR